MNGKIINNTKVWKFIRLQIVNEAAAGGVKLCKDFLIISRNKHYFKYVLQIAEMKFEKGSHTKLTVAIIICEDYVMVPRERPGVQELLFIV